MKRRGVVARLAGLVALGTKLGIDALGVKKATELVAQRRRPRRSLWARVGVPALVLGAAGGAAGYLAKSGRAGDLLERATGSLRATAAPDDGGHVSAPPPPPAVGDSGSEVEIDLRERPVEST
jgi:hypothetical protein